MLPPQLKTKPEKDPSRAEIIAEILKNIDILTKIFQILPFWKITENAHLL